MPIIEVPVPNLLGGVSQQPAAGRIPGQVEACDNALLHVVTGLAKRKGTRHIAKLFPEGEAETRGYFPLVHLIHRDSMERYVMLVGERRVRIFNADTGEEVFVYTGVSGVITGHDIDYLDPRTYAGFGFGGEMEDFTLPPWLSTAANTGQTTVLGVGPFGFGATLAAGPLTADRVVEIGNGAAATINDIYQAAGTFGELNVASVFLKESPNFACNDVELALVDTTNAVTHFARFDLVSSAFQVGAVSTGVHAEVEDLGHGWYRCWIRVEEGAVPTTTAGDSRRYRLRFHTNAASPANKRVLAFGTALSTGVREPEDYVLEDPFRALTIADTTFLVNRRQTPVMSGTTSGRAANSTPGGLLGRAFFFVRQGGVPDTRYQVKITYTALAVPSTATFAFTTSTVASATEDFRTDEDIAEALRVAIDAHGDFSAIRQGSVVEVLLQAATGAIHSIECSDSRGDKAMVGIVNSIERFTDLPLILRNGYVVKVEGDPERDADDYYVRFQTDDGSTTVGSSGPFGKGKWFETLAIDTETTIEGDTMPILLQRRQDDATGTETGIPGRIYFQFNANTDTTYDARAVGDVLSNADPSFIGLPIQDLFLYRGRLGFLAGENVILSEVGEVFNFWRTTVLQLVDSDTIDINAGIRDVVEFQRATPTSNHLLLFSDRHQFELLGEPTLTPASAQLVVVRAFQNLARVLPADTGRGVIFTRASDAFSGLCELALLQDDTTFRFEDLTLQTPQYIAGQAQQVVHSSLVGLTVVRAEDPEILYLHQSYEDQEEQRLQSAVHRWTFDPNVQIRGLGFLEADLRLVVEREGEGWFLETVLTDSQTTEGGRPITHLDRRVDETQVTAVYDGGADETEITLPYDIADGAEMQVVDAVSGLIVPIISDTANSVTVSGDLSSSALYVGEAYTLAVTLTEPVLQDAGANGRTVPRMSRPINVNRLYLYLADTAFLEVHVSPDLRTESVEDFSAAGLGTGLLLQGVLTLFTGDADFAIIGRSTELTVSIQNPTPFPSLIESARWECVYRSRAATA